MKTPNASTGRLAVTVALILMSAHPGQCRRMLNPQPLPPVAPMMVRLNPQPLPPFQSLLRSLIGLIHLSGKH